MGTHSHHLLGSTPHLLIHQEALEGHPRPGDWSQHPRRHPGRDHPFQQGQNEHSKKRRLYSPPLRTSQRRRLEIEALRPWQEDQPEYRRKKEYKRISKFHLFYFPVCYQGDFIFGPMGIGLIVSSIYFCTFI